MIETQVIFAEIECQAAPLGCKANTNATAENLSYSSVVDTNATTLFILIQSTIFIIDLETFTLLANYPAQAHGKRITDI